MQFGHALSRYRQDVGPKPAASVERYARFVGDVTRLSDEAAFTGWLRALEADGLKRGSVDLYRRHVQAFCRHFDLPAPRARSWRYDPREAARPALSPDLVLSMVAMAVQGDLGEWDTALLALSTVYGTRAEEMARVRRLHVDLQGQRLLVSTAKHGEVRWMWVPPEIVPHLDVEWPQATAPDVYRAFNRIWSEATDTEKPRYVGWHAIRRALHLLLAKAGVTEEERQRFGRWKAGGGSMARWYAGPNIMVSDSGLSVADLGDQGTRQYDAASWDAHPFVGAWR